MRGIPTPAFPSSSHSMSRRTLGWFLAALVPLGMALAATVLWRANGPLLVLSYAAQADLGNALVLAGLVISGLLVMGVAGRLWAERREAALKAEQATAFETERRRFIQRLDHELKNPLTAIQVQLDNLQAAPSDQAIEQVRDQANRLGALTRGLRRLADLESRPLEIETVDMAELLDEVCDLVDAGERIQLDVQRVPWPIPPVQADRELLLLAIRNLIENALKFSTGPVQVRARDAAGSLQVEVIDTGRGIPPDDLAHVAEELYRGSNVRDISGSGLGLAMVQRIAARHSGRLDLRSRSGQGTIASLTLPYG